MSEAAAAGWRGTIGLRLGIALALAMLLLGFVSLVWTPYPVGSVDVGVALQAPNGTHWLGTDPLGRDVLSQMMKGMLTSFVVAAVAVAIGALIGVPLGLAAATWRRVAELPVAAISGYFSALPLIFSAILLATMFGPGAASLMVAIGITNIAALTRVTRDAMRAAVRPNYVAAARLAGLGFWDIATRYTIPTVGRAVLGCAVGELALGIVAEAALSYFGLGTQAPTTSLGLLLRDAAGSGTAAPLAMVVPGLAIVVTVLALRLVSGGLGARGELRGDA